MQPLEDRVLIEPIAGQTTTPGGIVMPDIRGVVPEEEESQRAIVVAVGPGEWVQNVRVDYEVTPHGKSIERHDETWFRKPLDVHPGDEVLVVKYGAYDVNDNLRIREAGREVTIEGRKLRMVDYKEIMAVLKRAKRERDY